MKLKNKTYLFVSILMLLGIMNKVSAQKYEKIKAVRYFQLPGINDTYKYADVFIMFDEALTAGGEMGSKGMSMDLGKFSSKFTGKKSDNTNKTEAGKAIGKIGDAMKKAVAKALKPKAESYTRWDLFPPHFSNGKGKLKVVVTYAPNENSRPMGTPSKNNKGLYVVNYKVLTHVKVFDANNKLIADQNFGLVSGTGYSKNWPAAAKGMGGLTPKVKVVEENENGNHPFTDVCIEGALDQAKRVVYGMYGIKKIDENIGVYSFKELKESSDYAKKYTETLEQKTETLLSKNEIAIMKECTTYWESILGQVPEDQVWAVHHNIALGYSWMLNSTKSKEHLAKLRKLHAPTFDKIQAYFSGNAEKGTSINGKEMKKLEIFNANQPFMEYYAAGINKHPTWPGILDKPYDKVLYAFVINNMIAGQAKLPFPLPIYPVQKLNANPKKLTGQISKNGEAIANLNYKMKKGNLLALELSSAKGKGKMSDNISFGEVFADGSDDGGLGSSTYILRSTRAYKNFGVTPKGYYIGGINLKNAICTLPIDYKDLKYWEMKDAVIDVDFCSDSENIKKYTIEGSLYLQGDSWDACHAKIEMVVSKQNASGYPEEITVKWVLKGYTNDDDANNFLKNRVTGSRYDSKLKVQVFKKTNTYTINWSFNKDGDWTSIKTGDISINRSFN